jgi:hypothetical protein
MRLLSVFTVCVLLGGTAVPASPRRQAPTTAKPAGTPQEYLFPSGAGVLFFHVHPDKTADFEGVVARLSEVLDKVGESSRKQQAASWRIYKSAEAPRGSVIYMFFFDPAVFGADYDPVKVLSEALPADVKSLYERLRADVVRVERMGLVKMR